MNHPRSSAVKPFVVSTPEDLATIERRRALLRRQQRSLFWRAQFRAALENPFLLAGLAGAAALAAVLLGTLCGTAFARLLLWMLR